MILMHNKNNLHFILAKMAEVYPIGKVIIAPGTLASFIALFIGYFTLLKLGIALYFTFILSSLSGIKKIQMRKNKEKKIYNFGKLFAPNSSKKNPTKNTPKQKAIDPLTLNFP